MNKGHFEKILKILKKVLDSGNEIVHKRTSRLREISERFFAGRAGNGEIPGFANRGSGLGIRAFVSEFFSGLCGPIPCRLAEEWFRRRESVGTGH